MLRSFLLAAVAVGATAFDYSGYATTTTLVDSAQVDAFEALLGDDADPEIQVWKKINRGANVEFHLLLSEAKQAELKAHPAVTGWEVENNDVQGAINRETFRIQSAPRFNATNANAFFDEFRPVDQQQEFLKEIIRNNPSIVTEVEFGSTWEGVEIPAIVISGAGRADDKPAIYIQAGVHCREWISISSTYYLINELVNRYVSGERETVTLLDTHTFYIVPTVNIDGYKYTWTNNRYWRKNRRANPNGTRGVDINRNWGPDETHCTAGSSTNPSSDTYCGPNAFSEPETTAARDFIMSHPNIRAAVDMHTYGPLLLWPWQYTYNRLPSSEDYNMFVDLGARQQSAIQQVDNQRYVSQQGSDLYPHSGGLIDWSWDHDRIKAFTYEGRGRDFVVPNSQIVPAGAEQFAGLMVLANDI